jgi:phage gpG-like protein
MIISFSPWGTFRARKKPEEIRRWLRQIGDASVRAFKGGMGRGPAPSAPGAWPNVQTGRLRGSIRSEVTTSGVTVGSNTPYSGYLRTGTSKMARRKMSDNALKEGMRGARLAKWVEFSRS